MARVPRWLELDAASSAGSTTPSARGGARLARRVRGPRDTCLPLTALARVALRRGDLERAGLLWGAVLRRSERATRPLGPRPSSVPRTACRETRSPSSSRQSRTGARAATLRDAVALALGERGSDGAVELRARRGRTASCRRTARAPGPRARPGTSPRARAARSRRTRRAASAGSEHPRARSLVVPRRADPEEDRVHELPRLGQELHDPERADARDDILLEARLHPGERAGEARVDAVVRAPSGRSPRGSASRLAGGPVDRWGSVALRPGARSRWPGTITRRQREAVTPRQLPRAHVVAGCDREEALTPLDDMRPARARRRASARYVLRSRDSVGGEAVPLAGSAGAHARSRVVKRPSTARAREPVPAQPELEHRDVPADRADRELALPEERTAPRSERAPGHCGRASRRREALRAAGSERARSASAGPRTPSTGPGSNPCARSPTWSAAMRGVGCRAQPRSDRETPMRQRDADDGEATHAEPVRRRGAALLPRPGSPGAAGYNPPAAFPGSSIGRASGC